MQKSELDLIIETIPDAVTIIDSSGNIIYANRAAEIILGLGRSRIKERTYNAVSWKITTQDGRPFPEEELPFNQVMKSKKPIYGVVHAIEKPDGSRKILSINAAPLLDKSGNVESVVASLTDISEQKRAAEEISESRRQVLDILESITDAFYALDNDWRLTYVNHRAEELFGVKREQLLFKNIWQLIRKEQSPEIYEKYHKAKEQLVPVIFENYSPRVKKWLEMHVYPYRNGISVYIRDVTDRKQVETARATTLHFFESMDRINRAIAGTNDLNQVMSDVLDVVLSIFNCDRAFLLYPCDPDTPTWTVPMERTRPEYPGVEALGIEMPIDPDVAATFRVLLESNGPVEFGPESEHPLPADVAEKFNFKSFVGMALYPKVGKPWEFGLHQCSYPRVWTSDEKKLFNETGRRLADGLTSLLTNREMQRSELKYRELFEETYEGIYITSPKGKILDINKKGIETLGYDTKEEVLSLDLAQNVYVHPEDRKQILEMVDKLNTYEYDVAIKKKSGQEILTHCSLTAVRDESGNIISYRGTIRDITGQKHIEEQVMLLNFALDHVREAAYLINEDARIIYANDEALRMLGYTRSELLGGISVLDFDIEMTEKNWKEHWKELKKLDSIIFEGFHRAKDGRVFPVEINANLFNYQGIDYNLALVRNITERKEVEDALRTNEERYRMAQSIGRVGNWEYNLQTAEFWGSDEAKRIYGFDPEQPGFTTEEVESRIPERESVHQALIDLVEKGKPYDLEFEIIPKNSTIPRIITSVAKLQLDEKGNPLKVAGVIQDVTKRKHAEEQVMLLNFALDHVREAAYLINENARIIYANDEALRMLGYNRSELFRGMNVFDVDLGMTGEAWKEHWKELKEQGSIIFEGFHKAKDGRIFPVEINANLFNYQGIDYNLALARDITERKEKERLSATQNNINTIMSSSLDFEKILERSMPLAIDALGVESASIVMLEGSNWVTKYGFPNRHIGRRYRNEDAPYLALAAEMKSPVVINDIYSDPRIGLEHKHEGSDRAKLVTPLIIGKELMGLLVFSSRQPMIFSNDQVDFATKIVTSTSFALENARLFETERDIADTLQEALLTIPVHIKGIEYGFLYRSATEATKVGGDFFDIFELERGKIGVIVGDVSGKGLQAASLTSVVKSIVRAYAYEETSPANIMKKTNETVKRAIPSTYFITLFLGIIDIERGTITYSSAGHPPALIKKRHSIERLSVQSPIIGALAGINYEQDDVVIGPDDVLILYTDGITEARSSNGEFFGEERLGKIVENIGAVSIKDMPQIIFNEVMDFSDGRLIDDVVLLSLSLD
jgi:PAS domain S-box-containing protein